MTTFALTVFDLDGTLVDSLPDIAAALNRTLQHAGRAPLPRDQIAGYVGDGAAKLLQRALPDGTPAQTLEELGAHFRASYAQHLHDETRPYPGLEPVLRRLAEVMPLAVLTNKPIELARPLLAGLGLERYFADIVGDGDGFARALGAPAAAVTWGYVARDLLVAERPTWIVDVPESLLAVALGAAPEGAEHVPAG